MFKYLLTFSQLGRGCAGLPDRPNQTPTRHAFSGIGVIARGRHFSHTFNFSRKREFRRVLMVNRSGVGPAFARVRGLVLLVLLVLGAAWLLRLDIATPHSRSLPASSTQIQASLARLPISFEPNQGQSDSAAKFVAHGRG